MGVGFSDHVTPRGPGGDLPGTAAGDIVRDRFGNNVDKTVALSPEEESKDVRTNFIDYDTLGCRHKPWRLACESKQERQVPGQINEESG